MAHSSDDTEGVRMFLSFRKPDFCGVVLTFLLVVCQLGWATCPLAAQEIESAVESMSSGATGEVTGQSSAVSLDLTSTERTIEASSHLFGAATETTILRDEGSHTIQPGQLLTPAEFAALNQVLSTGQQTLNVDSAGRAIGGQLTLTNLGYDQLSSLVVPQNVTTIGGTTDGALNVTGLLSNYGSILGFSPNATTLPSSFTINAQQLFNAPNALISTVLSGSNAAVNLIINTQADVINYGTISSSGILNINAGGSIINGMAPAQAAAQAASQATMSAALSATLNSATGNIVNAGLISAATANLNLQALQSNLTVNGGGTLSADEINFASSGVIRAALDEIIGTVNVKGAESYISVKGGTLTIGNIDLSGDPYFVNETGDVYLAPNPPPADPTNTTLTFSGENLAVLAGGNVFASGGLTAINLSSSTGNGGSLFISAGLTPQQDPNDATIYTLGAPTTSGGSVLLGGVSINTSSTAADSGDPNSPNNAGGNVTIVAKDNNSLNEANGSGRVQIGSINTSSLSGTGGDVLVVAQAGPLDLSSSTITVSGATGGGKIEIFGGAAESNNLTFVNGTQTAGTVLVAPDAGHEPVSFNFNMPTFAFDFSLTPAQNAGEVKINTSGDITQSGIAAIYADDILVRSRVGAQTYAGTTYLWAAKNVLLDAGTGTDGVTCCASSISFNGTGNYLYAGDSLSLEAYGGNLTVGSQSQLYGFLGTISTWSLGDTTLGDSVDLASTQGNYLGAVGKMTIGDQGSLFSIGSQILASGGDLTIGDGKQITSGLLKTGTPTTGLLTYDQFTRFGGFYAISIGGNLSIDSSITTNGLDIAGFSQNGSVSLGSNNQFIANGGNIEFFAQGPLTGNSNLFYSRAVGANNDFDGGLIELSSGFSFNPFTLTVGTPNVSSSAASLSSEIIKQANHINTFIKTPDQPFTSPPLDENGFVTTNVLGSNVQIDNNGINVGLVLPTVLSSTPGAASVDLSGSTLSLRKGAIFLDAIGDGANVSMPNSVFATESYGVLPTSFSSIDFTGIVSEALNQGLTNSTEVDFKLPDFLFGIDFINQNSNRATQFAISLGNQLSSRQDARQRAESAMATAMTIVGRFSASNAARIAPRVDTGRTESIRFGGMTNMVMLPGSNSSPLGITGGAVAAVPVRVSESRADLILFTTAGQVMTQVSDLDQDASVIGARGTVLSKNDKNVVLHVGKVFANSGDKPLEIATEFGAVVVSPGSSAAVVSEPGKPSRVVAISGKESAVTIRARSVPPKEIVLSGGEEASIEMKETEPLAPIADDGAPHPTHRVVVMSGKADMASLLQGEKFYAGSSLRLGGTSRVAYQRLINNIVETPGGGGTRVLPPNATTRIDNPSRVLAEEGTVFQQDADKHVAILYGSIFMHAKGDQIVGTPFGDVKVSDDSMMAVEANGRQVRVRSFDDGVAMNTKGRAINLAIGQELLLQEQRATKDDSLPNDGIARRRLKQIQVGDGLHGVLGEFSIFSCLSTNQKFKPVRLHNTAADKQLNAFLLKQSVALDMVTGKHGRYFVKPTETAYAP